MLAGAIDGEVVWNRHHPAGIVSKAGNVSGDGYRSSNRCQRAGCRVERQRAHQPGVALGSCQGINVFAVGRGEPDA